MCCCGFDFRCGDGFRRCGATAGDGGACGFGAVCREVYEIARYPNRFEKECAREVTAEYAALPNGKISVVNTCLKSDGKAKQSKGSAVVVDKASNSKLSVTFFWPFSGKYWILDLGPQYEYAVVGEPSRRYLWILSRSKSVTEEQYREITSRLAAKGYDAAKLVRTAQ